MFVALVAAVLLTVSFETPSAAPDQQRQQQYEWCWGNTFGANKVTADQKIAGCNGLLQSGQSNARQTADVLVMRSRAYRAKNDTVRQMADLDEAVRSDPAYSLAWAEKCLAHLNQGHDSGRAADECTTALTLDPESASAWAYRGDLYLNEVRYDLAISDYDRAIALSPDWMWPWNDRGCAYLYSGKLDLALENFEKVIQLAPDLTIGYSNLGQVHIKLNQLHQARADYDTCLRIDDHDAGCMYGRGVVKRLEGDLAGGTSDISAAVAMDANVAKEFEKVGIHVP